jgi:hypothetical protein
MSLLERIETNSGEDEIEPGKRLIRAGDDQGVSLSERLSHLLHRLSWRTPLHSLRLRGRFPLKLLAVPKDPIAGDKAAGEAMLAGTIAFGRESVPVASLDFADPGLSPQFSDYLQSFAWLRDLAAAGTRERGARVAEALVKNWLDAYASQVCQRGWRADLWGRRILFWTAYAPYILSSKDMVYRSAVLNTLARGARHLEKGADRAPLGLARISAWAGVIASALVVQGGPARLSKGEAGLARALGTSVHEDGGLVSRSPIEQLAFVELMAQLRAAYIAGRRDMPDFVADTLAGSVAALLAVMLGTRRCRAGKAATCSAAAASSPRWKARARAAAPFARPAAGAISGFKARRAWSCSTAPAAAEPGAGRRLRIDARLRVQRRHPPPGRQLRRRRARPLRASGGSHPGVADDRGPFDPHARRPQFHCRPRGRHARQGRQPDRALPRRDRRPQPGRSQP